MLKLMYSKTLKDEVLHQSLQMMDQTVRFSSTGVYICNDRNMITMTDCKELVKSLSCNAGTAAVFLSSILTVLICHYVHDTYILINKTSKR